MKSRNIGFGVFLLSIGLIWFLINLDMIKVPNIINSFIMLWPLILIVIGVNVLFKHRAFVRGVSWLLFLTVIVSYSYFAESKFIIDDKNNKTLSEQMDTDIKSREINIKFGATRIKIDSDTEKLFEASVPGSTNYSRSGSDKEILNFEKKNHTPFNFGENGRSCEFHLNENVEWKVEVDAGAVSGTLDMTKLKVNKLNLNIGFGSMDLKFGSNSEKTVAVIKTGFSSVNAAVPKSAGVRVKIKEGLSSSNVKGLGWERQGDWYVSTNYDEAESKIDLEVKTGFSSFDLEFY
jgi:hypothetical protein